MVYTEQTPRRFGFLLLRLYLGRRPWQAHMECPLGLRLQLKRVKVKQERIKQLLARQRHLRCISIWQHASSGTERFGCGGHTLHILVSTAPPSEGETTHRISAVPVPVSPRWARWIKERAQRLYERPQVPARLERLEDADRAPELGPQSLRA